MLPPGFQLGRYIISHRLGAGGMGDVYLALDHTLDRYVAVKVLPDAVAADPDRLTRFVREAKAASALNHPNILTVHDFAEQHATRYLVTEFVDGQTLRAWSADARRPLAEILDVMCQAASALAAAHAAGVVHRDIKPDNLMLRRDGLLKVLDFGIAKLTTTTATLLDTDAAAAAVGVTRPGAILGTVGYMSPEQAAGEVVDARTDIWSLGVVLYSLLARRAPFAKATPMATLAAILEREPEPLASAAPGTPEVVCRIVAKALRKQKQDRFETADELARALEAARRDLAPAGAPGPAHDEAETRVLAAAAAERDTPRSQGREPSRTPTNLPPRTSALIGRERELEEVSALLRADGTRLLTLTGPGGTGKTRLAFEVARLVSTDFADGVFGVDLTTLADPEGLAVHIAEVVGVEASAERSLVAELERHLANMCVLLVLDNFEHLLAAAPAVSRLLAVAPRLTVLTTSRALLHLSLEREYAVEPLTVPVFTSLPELDELSRAPAVALFLERAREAKRSFALTAENARTVVEICRRVEGLPLAIELAAARVKLFAPAALLAKLENQLKLLTGGARDLPSRQQTMRGAVAWSYDLLDEREQWLLGRLAVFVGGCCYEAVESVCGAEWELEALDGVSSLVDKSLLRQREEKDGESRFHMLEVVREYALERLEASGEAGAARHAHARYFRHLAREAEPKLASAERLAWLERLGREYDNLRAALPVMLEEEPEEGAAFVADLSHYWRIRSHEVERRLWVAKALEKPAAPALRALLLCRLSSSEYYLGDFRAATDLAREAVDVSRASGDTDSLARSLNVLGLLLVQRDDLPGAMSVLGEGLEISREQGYGEVLRMILNNLGVAALRAGDRLAARAYYEQALEAVGRDVGAARSASPHVNLGALWLEDGDFAAAARSYREGLSIAAEDGTVLQGALALDGLAAVALEAGMGERAARLAGAAEALVRAAASSLEPSEQLLHDRTVAALRAALDVATLEREWARGQAMTFEEAAAEALGA